MSMNDLVSIIVPIYNGERFLSENVESILNQTYKNIEVIYICDSCTDQTVAILKQYMLSDSRLKVQIVKKRRAAVARNIGLKMARGNWIIFLDSDDLFEKKMIETLVKSAVSSNADMSCCFWEEFDDQPTRHENINNVRLKLFCKTYPIIEVEKEKKHILQLIFHCPWTKLVHKSVYEKEMVFFQDLPNCDDAYFSFVSAVEARKIVYVDKILVYYRSNKGRKTLSSDQNKKKNYVWEAYDLFFKYICQRNDNQELKRSFYNRVCGDIYNLIGTDLYEEICNSLYGIYFDKWEMTSIDIENELSYINREIYKMLCKGEFSVDRDSLTMRAKAKFVQDTAEKGNCSLWGCGYFGQKLLEELGFSIINIQHIFDSDSSKWDVCLYGKTVECFNENWVENMIVTSSKYFEEIKSQIGNRAGKIYNLDEEILCIK